MKNALSILTLSVLISFFLSCDGRDRIHKSAETVLKENKLLDSFSENITYIPESYSEKVTDTIFSNGYNVYIKQYTDNSRVIEIKEGNNIKTYKDFNVDLKVSKDDDVIFDKSLNIKDTIINEQLQSLDLKNSYLKNVWTEKKDKYNPEIPCILIEFFNPKTMDSSIVMITPFKGYFNFTEL